MSFSKFQSMHPLRGATSRNLEKPRIIVISIHAPLAGCDRGGSMTALTRLISIHAPLAGCDIRLRSGGRLAANFNPCTPCGVRPTQGTHFAEIDKFQSMHPLRGATDRAAEAQAQRDISIHAPLAGCDAAAPAVQESICISIHAPLAGCDSKIAEIFPANLRKSYKISAKPNKERRCCVLGKGKAAAISGLARCEPPSRILNAFGSHQIMSAPSGA